MDARYMSGARWDYAGLYVLEDGDHLTIYSKENPDKIVWSGTVKLGVNELSSSQEGIDHAQWLEWFQNEHPAWLIPVRPRTVV